MGLRAKLFMLLCSPTYRACNSPISFQATARKSGRTTTSPCSRKPEDAFALPEIDLIVIATPNSTHFDLASKGISAGKHVVVDKPFTVTSEEAAELISLAKKHQRVLSVFQSRRWDADFLTLRQILREGSLGEVVQFESRYDRYRPEPRQRWREQAVPGAGVWFDLGSHLVDQALQLLGPPDAIYADLELQRRGAQAVDYFHAVLRYGRSRAILTAGCLVVSETPRFAVHGTAGGFTKFGMDTQEESLKRGEVPGGRGWGHDPRTGTSCYSRKTAGLKRGKCPTSPATIWPTTKQFATLSHWERRILSHRKRV